MKSLPPPLPTCVSLLLFFPVVLVTAFYKTSRTHHPTHNIVNVSQQTSQMHSSSSCYFYQPRSTGKISGSSKGKKYFFSLLCFLLH
ncbi:Uncharacterized protein APZ42_018531 [Daphnia magna]|uniref:Uncharacterized protein n=1 Tax=Daphnia magna TaxID=35525 RepID=A0A164Z1J2_9CRUS|nr:Uncharacterized protein APZ42_018531 [Daphnia magna]